MSLLTGEIIGPMSYVKKSTHFIDLIEFFLFKRKQVYVSILGNAFMLSLEQAIVHISIWIILHTSPLGHIINWQEGTIWFISPIYYGQKHMNIKLLGAKNEQINLVFKFSIGFVFLISLKWHLIWLGKQRQTNIFQLWNRSNR